MEQQRPERYFLPTKCSYGTTKTPDVILSTHKMFLWNNKEPDIILSTHKMFLWNNEKPNVIYYPRNAPMEQRKTERYFITHEMFLWNNKDPGRYFI